MNAGVGRSAFWLMCAKTLAFLSTFALPLVLVRQLSQTEFGLYKQAFLIVSTATTLLPLGFALSAFYFFPREPDKRPGVVFNILVFYVAVGGILGLLLTIHPPVLKAIFNSSELVGYAPLIGATILFWVATSWVEFAMVANQEMRLAATFIVLTNLTKTLALLVAGLWFSSLRALLCAAVVYGTLQAVFLLGYLASRFPSYWVKFDRHLARSQCAYALPHGFAGLLAFLQMDLPHYFVSNRLGPTAYAVYAVGCLQLPLLGILGESISSVMIPQVSHLQATDRRREILLLTARMLRKLAALYFPLYVLLLVVGREFLVVLFTPQYLASWPIFALNLTMIPLSLLLTACDPVTRAYGEHRYFLIRLRMILSVPYVLGLSYATARFGLVGAIAVVVGCTLLERSAWVLKVGSILGVTRRDLWLFGDLGKLGGAAVVAGVLAEVARKLLPRTDPLLVLVLCGVVFALAYGLGVHLLGVLEEEERALLGGRLGTLGRARARIAQALSLGGSGASGEREPR